jgi:hypothetical protein
MVSGVLVALALTGCASISLLPGHHGGSIAGSAIGQDGPPADPAEVAVVRGWAAALRAGEIKRAATYFHLPMVFDNGGQLKVRTLAQAEAVNVALACGATVISAFRQGRFVNVLFRLSARQGRGGGPAACGSGIGQSARTEFLIRGGRIAEWLRAPSRPGDPGYRTTPTVPSTGTTGGTPV